MDEPTRAALAQWIKEREELSRDEEGRALDAFADDDDGPDDGVQDPSPERAEQWYAHHYNGGPDPTSGLGFEE